PLAPAMRFELKAIGPEGNVELLDFQAQDEASAVQALEGRGYTILSVRPRRSLLWQSGRARFPLVLFSQELRALLQAGLPLVESIDTLAQKERTEEWRLLLERVAATLREGRPLSAALEQFPQAFGALYIATLYIATVRAAERTSDLAPALARYIAYATQLEAIRKRVVNASIYPLLLMAVGGMVALFLLLYVVPRFGRIYAERGGDLPLFSRWLLAWGQAVDEHGLLVLAVAAVVIVAAIYLLRSFREEIANLLWRLPAIGERLKVYQLARFYRTIGMLVRGGTPLVNALESAGELLHPLLRGRLTAASRAVAEGHKLSQSMEANGLTTPVAARLLVVGERGGNIGEMLESIAAFHDEEMARWVDWFTRLFEPILMALIGLVIGVIVILMYMPIFELAGSLQ
ncbi:MAG: Type secretion system domain protein, partial [Burkholderiales bacterium]|nr:Type secretion system domain protein [Burkholderiales bacterium]